MAIEDLKSLRMWGWGLLAAVLSSVGDAGAAFLVAPKLVTEHWQELWPVLAFTAAKSVFLYFKQRPIPVPKMEDPKTEE